MKKKISEKNVSDMPTLTLTLIFMGMFALISVFELVQQTLEPVLTPWGSRFITIIVASASAVFIAFFPLRALRDTEGKFKAIYEDSHDAILLLDENTLIDCNRRALQMFGIPDVEDLITHTPAMLSPRVQPGAHGSPSTLCDHIGTAYRDGFARFEGEFLRRGGDRFPADVQVSSFTQGNRHLLQATIRDISEQKHIETALQESNERFFSYIRETALRLKIPVGVVHENIAGVIADIEGGEIDSKNILLQLRLQEKNLVQIQQNVRNLNQRIFDHPGDIPSAPNDLPAGCNPPARES
ncbi:PAS domain-containing protein [Methanoregula sp.]|uniref:PAS domain-containing protein n=1 Tax=Methanoregula sp. TaxID=2052170 RepID=UPI00356541CB